jgi:pimeloyl-ACP methyl ester carboxylesterase
MIRGFEKVYNVVALDFLGHGGSASPNDPQLYTVNEHLEDLKTVYEAHKKERNVFVSHCYGAIHTLRLVKWLRDGGRTGEVVGVALLSLGARAPVSLGMAKIIPAFILGKYLLSHFVILANHVYSPIQSGYDLWHGPHLIEPSSLPELTLP